MHTKLLYIDDFISLTAEATVIDRIIEDDRDIVILDQTIFYPQGGGQPYDQGTITSSSGKFFVEEVRFVDGLVRHIGKLIEGAIAKGDKVVCRVDEARRILHARLHSAGHLIDKAILELNLGWTPGKGYHYPNGPYDEYEGSITGLDKEALKSDIEAHANSYVEKGGKTEIIFMTREEMRKACHYTPDFPDAKEARARIVIHDGYYMPCGGTPVAELSAIGRITVRKIKQEGAHIRVAYDIE